MAIKGPKGAIPTLRGWVNPNTGELLKSQRITTGQIQEWNGHVEPTPVHEEPVIQSLHEAPHIEMEIEAPTYKYFSTKRSSKRKNSTSSSEE